MKISNQASINKNQSTRIKKENKKKKGQPKNKKESQQENKKNEIKKKTVIKNQIKKIQMAVAVAVAGTETRD